jgi:hypothetical protein
MDQDWRLPRCGANRRMRDKSKQFNSSPEPTAQRKHPLSARRAISAILYAQAHVIGGPLCADTDTNSQSLDPASAGILRGLFLRLLLPAFSFLENGICPLECVAQVRSRACTCMGEDSFNPSPRVARAARQALRTGYGLLNYSMYPIFPLRLDPSLRQKSRHRLPLRFLR